jgi:hypothetical protein
MVRAASYRRWGSLNGTWDINFIGHFQSSGDSTAPGAARKRFHIFFIKISNAIKTFGHSNFSLVKDNLT